MQRLTLTILAALVLVIGCVDQNGSVGDEGPSLPDVTHEGEFLSYAVAEGETICGGTALAADEMAIAMVEALGGTVEGKLATYYVMPPEMMDELTNCPDGEDGEPRTCTGLDEDEHMHAKVYGSEAGSFHELVHIAHNVTLPESMPILEEGMAMMLDPVRYAEVAMSYTFGETTDEELDQALGASPYGSDFSYLLAWYLAHTIYTHGGLEALVDIWHLTPHGSTAADLRSAYFDVLGREMGDDLVFAEFGGIAFCPVAICPEPPRGLDDGVWSWTSANSCDDDNVIGLTTEGELLSYETVDLSAGSYRLQAPGDDTDQARLRLCDSVCDGARIDYDMDEVVELEAGRYIISALHDPWLATIDKERSSQTVTLTRID